MSKKKSQAKKPVEPVKPVKKITKKSSKAKPKASNPKKANPTKSPKKSALADKNMDGKVKQLYDGAHNVMSKH